MSELEVLDDENCIRSLMRNLEKCQEQKPIGDKSREAELRKMVKNKEKKAFKFLWQQKTQHFEKEREREKESGSQRG